MLSILIPTYNYNTLPLVTSLHRQAVACEIPFEIICFDDGSNSAENVENEKINALPYGCFEELPDNAGLSQNRNLLAQKAQYEYLLFIDGDARIPHTEFVSKYAQSLPFLGIVYGGRKHPETCPSNAQKLRWTYGIKREDKVAEIRKQNPYPCLLFNNSLLHRPAFEAIKFEQEITTYGYEDTLFAFQAQQQHIPVLHIENPVEHKDIDTNPVYLEKTRTALKNLLYLYEGDKIASDFITLLKYYGWLKRFRLTKWGNLGFKRFHKILIRNLLSSSPSMFLFQLYKLGYFCTLNQKT